MWILITGPAGFVRSRPIEKLVERMDHDLYALQSYYGLRRFRTPAIRTQYWAGRGFAPRPGFWAKEPDARKCRPDHAYGCSLTLVVGARGVAVSENRVQS